MSKKASARASGTDASSTPAPPAPSPSAFTPEPFVREVRNLGWRGWTLLCVVVLLFNLPVLHFFVFRGQQPATVVLPFADDFSNPASIESNYFSSGGFWRTVQGELLSPGVKNNPVWLGAVLPDDVVFELDVRCMSPEGDIRVELFGNGVDPSSGYVFVHGGWNNSASVVARLDLNAPPIEALRQKAREHGKSEAEVFTSTTRVRWMANLHPVQPGRPYHWRIESDGNRLRWFVDGQLAVELEDPVPLRGRGHDRVGLSGWESQLYFDNLSVRPGGN